MTMTYVGAPYSEATTSRDAAESVAPTTNATRATILKDFASIGPRGLTADEVGKLYPGFAQSGLTARLWELRGKGLLTLTEERRLTRRGRRARVYQITDAGLQAVALLRDLNGGITV